MRAQVLLQYAEQMSRLSSLLRPAPFALPALSASPALSLMPRACAAVGRGQRAAAPAGAPAKRRCENITWQEGAVSREAKERLLNQRGCVLWFTGLSGSGKSTVACTLEHALAARGILTTVLDGDNVRHGLNSNLGFSAEDREENVRRIGEVAKLMVEAGMVTLASFISPYRADRDRVRARQKPHDFIEIYMKARPWTAEGDRGKAWLRRWVLEGRCSACLSGPSARGSQASLVPPLLSGPAARRCRWRCARSATARGCTSWRAPARSRASQAWTTRTRSLRTRRSCWRRATPTAAFAARRRWPRKSCATWRWAPVRHFISLLVCCNVTACLGGLPSGRA